MQSDKNIRLKCRGEKPVTSAFFNNLHFKKNFELKLDLHQKILLREYILIIKIFNYLPPCLSFWLSILLLALHQQCNRRLSYKIKLTFIHSSRIITKNIGGITINCDLIFYYHITCFAIKRLGNVTHFIRILPKSIIVQSKTDKNQSAENLLPTLKYQIWALAE